MNEPRGSRRIKTLQARDDSPDKSRPERDPGPSRRFRFSLRWLLIGTAAVAALLYNLRVAWERTHQNLAENRIEQGLKVAYFSLKAKDRDTRALPAAVKVDAAGRPLYSWRFSLTPYIESPANPIDYDAAWDAPPNRQIAAGGNIVFGWARRGLATDVYAVTGSNTAFDVTLSLRFADLPPKLILLMEAGQFNTHWMQPGDYDVAKLLDATGRLGDTVKGVLKDRVHILFADGQVWALSPDMPIEALKPFLTIPAAKTADRDKQLARYRVD